MAVKIDGLAPLVALPFVLAVAPATMSACTFPDVDYGETSAGASEPPPPCAMPTACETTVTLCSKQASTQRGACLNKCGMGQTPDCTACQEAHDSAVNTCLSQCETCSADNGCANATDNCKGWLGL